MSKISEKIKSDVAKAAQRLALLNSQIQKAELILARLDQDIIAAGNVWATKQPQLIEANEQLILAALSAQTEIEASTQALKQISRAAEIDPLTQLPNRALLLDRLTHALVSAKRNNSLLALLFLDLNRFKEINDHMGHGAGDEVLKRVAYCLTSSVREADTVSRYGGDEFLILLAQVTQVSDAALIAKKILVALDTPFAIGNTWLSLRASIGISMYPKHGGDIETLIARADSAMYLAKKNNLGHFFYCDNEFTDDYM